MWIKYGTSTVLLAVVICCAPSSLSDEVEIKDNNQDIESKYPFLVSIKLFGLHQCTGTILAPTWILTAAYCAHDLDLKVIEYGVPQLDQVGGNVVTIKDRYFSDIVKGSNISHIALIQLQEPLVYNKYVSPVVPPIKDPKFVELVSWPYEAPFYGNGDVPETLNLRVNSNEECAEQYGKLWNSSINICTSYENDDEKKSNACVGVGAPLMSGRSQVGIAIQLPGGDFCDLPNLYIKISYYLKWIGSTMQKYSD